MQISLQKILGGMINDENVKKLVSIFLAVALLVSAVSVTMTA